jgi:hypothetical protein
VNASKAQLRCTAAHAGADGSAAITARSSPSSASFDKPSAWIWPIAPQPIIPMPIIVIEG